MDIGRIRRSFPILERRINDRPLVYLDNAASSLTPDEVIDAEVQFYRTARANVHRGHHTLSREATELFDDARREVAGFIGARRSEEIVFVSNATAALNLVAAGLGLPADSEVLTTAAEHHSAVLPWYGRYSIRHLKTDPGQPIDPARLAGVMSARTKIVVLAHVSNTSGVVQPIDEICQAARAKGVITVVDGSQSVPHVPIDVQQMGCDYLAFSGHKMLGPTGIGVLYGRYERLESLAPQSLGGGTIDHATANEFHLSAVPERFEAGTPNIAGAIGLAAAIRFLKKVGWDNITEHARSLARALHSGLRSLPSIQLLAPDACDLPIASFFARQASISTYQLSEVLSDRYGIMTRSGLHCAHPLFDALGRTDGAVRISAYIYNTVAEIRYACECIGELLGAFRRQEA